MRHDYAVLLLFSPATIDDIYADTLADDDYHAAAVDADAMPPTAMAAAAEAAAAACFFLLFAYFALPSRLPRSPPPRCF